MKLLTVIQVFIMLSALNGYAQTAGGYKVAPWRLLEFSGNVGFQGMFSSVKYEKEGALLNKLERSNFTGRTMFNSKSYIMHPNLLVLDLNASYNPVFSKYATLGNPDYTTETIGKQLYLGAQILKEKQLSFTTRMNLSESYVNIDNITNYKRITKNFGGATLYKHRFLPIRLSYDARKSYLTNEGTGRELDQSGDIIQLNMSKDIKSNFYTLLHAVHKIDNTNLEKNNKLSSKTDRVSLNTTYKFSHLYRNRLSSKIDYFKRSFHGNNTRLSFYKRLDLKLSERMRWSNTGNYIINGVKNRDSKNFMLNSFLTHTLYQSLTSSAKIGYINTKSNFSKQTDYNYGIGARYKKKIPLNGNLRINYNYHKRINSTDGLSNILEENNQEYLLSDDDVVLLSHSNISRNSIVVRNITGTLIYDENIDYVIYEIGNFIEIQRLPGGLIENNSTVLISYTANQNGSYTINSNTNSFSAGINLFKDILYFNYNFSNQNFGNSSRIIYEAENYYKSRGYDGSISYRFFQGSLRYIKYTSDLVPYSQLSYNFAVRGNLSQKLPYSLTYNMDDFSLIQTDGRKEKRERLAGMLAYSLGTKSRLNLMIGYNKRNLDNYQKKWMNGRISYSTRIGALSFMANVNFYNNNTEFYEANYVGGNLVIYRNF